MIKECRNYLFLPIACGLLVATSFYEKKLVWLIFSLLLFFRICCMKKLGLFVLVFLCSLFACIRTTTYVNGLQTPLAEKIDEVVILKEDTIKINGDQLQAIVEMNNKKYQLYYRLKEESEKFFWQKAHVPNQIKINGSLSASEPKRNLHGFDQKKYHQSQGIHGVISVDEFEGIGRKTQLASFRYQIRRKLEQNLPQNLATYTNALIFGFRDENFNQLTEVYQVNGLLHLFALSGMHITIYLGSFHLLLKRLAILRRPRLILLSVAGIFVIIMTGGNFSVIRGVLSFMIAFVCLTFNLSLSKLDQWSLMCLILTLCFPLVLWSTGGRLSIFMAFLLLYIPSFNLKEWQQNLLFSFLIMPILVIEFGEWPLLGGVLTFLMVPIFKWFILPLCGFLTMFGSVTPAFILTVCEQLMTGINFILSLVTMKPLQFGKPFFFLAILLLLGLMLLVHQIKYRQKFILTAVVGVVIIASFSLFTPGMVAFIDVGQGDSLLIKLPFKKETFLIDTGGRLNFEKEEWQRYQRKAASEYNLLPVLKGSNIKKIDHLILTHNDADHLGEVNHLLTKIRVKNIYIGTGAKKGFAEAIGKLPIHTKLHQIRKGDTVGKYLKLHILAPENGKGENNDSVVTFFKIKKKRFLITGDLEIAGEEKLMEDYPKLKIDVLKIGHHGSNSSTSPAFLAQLKSQEAIISVGQNNRYGHPTGEVLKTLADYQQIILRTDQQGMIYYQWYQFSDLKRKCLIDFPVN
ncbi:DNA internalization-related competence protein ComEC/Rec2 [Enterococcus alishanensis]